MKILLTADTVGGVFSHAVELARALGERGVEVALATKGARLRADQRRELAGVAGLEVHESAFRLEWMDDPWDDVDRASAWLLAIEDRVRPDVVHLGDFAHGHLPFRAPVLVVAHSCVLSWFEAVRGTAAPPAWDRYRVEVGRGLRGADLVAAPSRAMASALRRHHGPLREVRVVPNGREAHAFPPGAKEPLVLAAGRLWDDAKNVAALVRLAPRLPWRVCVAGEEANPGSAGAAPGSGPPPCGGAGGHPGSGGAGRAAVALGRLSREELARWYARAGIYALPARYEPFGLTVLEAALAGCALVLGDVESLRENWEGAAEFARSGDDEALRCAIERLAGDAGRRAALAAVARARALTFTPGRMADGYLALYRELLAEAAR